VALGLVDGDPNLDAVFANTSLQRNRVCLGDGTGGFTCGNLSADTYNTLDLALGEISGTAPIFADGFEAGDTAAWSVSVP
jgi:hypothetical protein